MIELADYDIIFFDCDGVVLDSNRLKSDAFFSSVVDNWGNAAAIELVNYHKKHGGVSRYKKFDYFFNKIVSEQADEIAQKRTLKKYAELVLSGLLTAQIAPHLSELRLLHSSAIWLVASGGDQQELRQVFIERNIIDWFDGGVFGSPTDKMDIVRRELTKYVKKDKKTKALIFGDSQYDYQVAVANGIDFCFVKNWSEFEGGEYYFKSLGIDVIGSLSEVR